MVSLPEGSSRNFHPSNRRPLQAVGQIFGSSPQSPRSRSTALRLHRHGLGKGPLMVTENHFFETKFSKKPGCIVRVHICSHEKSWELKMKGFPLLTVVCGEGVVRSLSFRQKHIGTWTPHTIPWTDTDSGHRTSQEENRLPHCLAGWLRLVDLYDPYMGHNLRYKSSYSSGNLDMLNKCRILAHSWMNAH